MWVATAWSGSSSIYTLISLQTSRPTAGGVVVVDALHCAKLVARAADFML